MREVEIADGRAAGDDAGETSAPLLQAVDVTRTYRAARTRLFTHAPEIDAVRGVSLAIRPGDAVGIVGESGAGKSTLMRLLVAAERPSAGQIRFNGTDLWGGGREVMREFRRSVQIVLQNPRSSFDPNMSIGTSLVQPLRSLRIDCDAQARIAYVLDHVAIPTSVLRRRPHEFSGGQLQRLAIARALMPSPRVLVADEPVSALDVSIQAQVLNVLRDLVTDLGLALVLVTHDLAVVASVATHALVFADGRVVEEGHPYSLLTDPQQPATKDLVGAVITLKDGLAGKGLA